MRSKNSIHFISKTFITLCLSTMIVALTVSCGAEKSVYSLKNNSDTTKKDDFKHSEKSDEVLTIISDFQKFDNASQIITAGGGVEIYHPAKNIVAKCDTAKFFQNEGYLELIGNAFIRQENDNTIKAHHIKYYVETGRAVATPKKGSQVRSTFVLPADMAN